MQSLDKNITRLAVILSYNDTTDYIGDLLLTYKLH